MGTAISWSNSITVTGRLMADPNTIPMSTSIATVECRCRFSSAVCAMSSTNSGIRQPASSTALTTRQPGNCIRKNGSRAEPPKAISVRSSRFGSS
jgi:hypothetical protein